MDVKVRRNTPKVGCHNLCQLDSQDSSRYLRVGREASVPLVWQIAMEVSYHGSKLLISR